MRNVVPILLFINSSLFAATELRFDKKQNLKQEISSRDSFSLIVNGNQTSAVQIVPSKKATLTISVQSKDFSAGKVSYAFERNADWERDDGSSGNRLVIDLTLDKDAREPVMTLELPEKMLEHLHVQGINLKISDLKEAPTHVKRHIFVQARSMARLEGLNCELLDAKAEGFGRAEVARSRAREIWLKGHDLLVDRQTYGRVYYDSFVGEVPLSSVRLGIASNDFDPALDKNADGFNRVNTANVRDQKRHESRPKGGCYYSRSLIEYHRNRPPFFPNLLAVLRR